MCPARGKPRKQHPAMVEAKAYRPTQNALRQLTDEK